MEPSKRSPWEGHFDTIAEELVRLVTICDVRLRDPGVIDRIIKDDESVCGKPNPAAFRKLRELVAATYDSLSKSVDRLGSEETGAIAQAIIDRIDKRRQAIKGL